MFKKLKLELKISKQEFNGILVLIGLLLFVIALPWAYSILSPNNFVQHTTSIDKEIAQFYQQDSVLAPIKTNITHHPKVKDALFPFNPNTLSSSDWLKLGLKSYQIQNIMRYLAKGGKFYKKVDLAKIYGLSHKEYERLAPYIVIPETYTRVNRIPKQPENKPLVELNSADSIQLCEMKGIGPVLASRILKYRVKIGGFYSKEQLLEVYGIDSLKYTVLSSQISLNTALIKKYRINTASFEALKPMPYLSYKQKNAIINYRTQHGSFKTENDLIPIILLPKPLLNKIKPYLVFD